MSAAAIAATVAGAAISAVVAMEQQNEAKKSQRLAQENAEKEARLASFRERQRADAAALESNKPKLGAVDMSVDSTVVSGNLGVIK